MGGLEQLDSPCPWAGPPAPSNRYPIVHKEISNGESRLVFPFLYSMYCKGMYCMSHQGPSASTTSRSSGTSISTQSRPRPACMGGMTACSWHPGLRPPHEASCPAAAAAGIAAAPGPCRAGCRGLLCEQPLPSTAEERRDLAAASRPPWPLNPSPAAPHAPRGERESWETREVPSAAHLW